MAYEGAYRCAVLTPTKELFAGDVYYVDVPGFVGHYGVIKNHESLVATNHQGGKLTLWLDPEGKEQKVFLIHRGCTQMLHNHLAVLARFGCEADSIDVEKVQDKAEKLRAQIETAKADLVSIGDDEDRRAAAQAWIDTEEIHLSWYDAQIDFAVNGKESTKQ
ncbi:MAG: F0F1 ATP synthase subunit epsilon [Eggerthellaceae bacterium]|nr:F0F1 ATP synthase subunit epsilon [Eggerthellaceae bacterium]